MEERKEHRTTDGLVASTNRHARPRPPDPLTLRARQTGLDGRGPGGYWHGLLRRKGPSKKPDYVCSLGRASGGKEKKKVTS